MPRRRRIMSRVYVSDDKKGVIGQVASVFRDAFKNFKKRSDGFFTVGLSGGIAVEITIQALKELDMPDFQKWRFFFCTEALVPFDHPDSTFGAFRNLIPTVPGLNEAFFIKIEPDLPPKECEKDYTLKLRQFFMSRRVPDIDICILGMGTDGHICSLLPDHEVLLEREKWVASITDFPRPLIQSLTFTLPVLNAAKNVVLLVKGESRATALRDILAGLPENPSLPASMVNPHSGNLHWICDKRASALYIRELK